MCKCRECGSEFTKGKSPAQLFCRTSCRDLFNSRRKTRGADLYDLFMTMRYDRGTAKLLGVWAILCRMAQNWHEEDVEAGRKSFLPARQVLERHVQHVATKHDISKRSR